MGLSRKVSRQIGSLSLTVRRFIVWVFVVAMAWDSNALALPRPKVLVSNYSAKQVKIRVDLRSSQVSGKSRRLEIRRSSPGETKLIKIHPPKKQKFSLIDAPAVEASAEFTYRVRLTHKQLHSKWSKSAKVEIEVADQGGGPDPSNGNSNTNPGTSNPGQVNLPTGQTLCDESFFQGVLNLVNFERAGVGLVPLSINAQLRESAIVHSSAMASAGVMSHDNWFDEIIAAHYQGSHFGQNVANVLSTPTSVMNGWMSSAGHRANILKPEYRHLGVGCVKNAQGVNWWTQNFGG